MLRKTAVVLLAVILTACCAPQAAVLAAPEFSGPQGHWAGSYIEALADKVDFPGMHSRQAYEFLMGLGCACVYNMGGITDGPHGLEP